MMKISLFKPDYIKCWAQQQLKLTTENITHDDERTLNALRENKIFKLNHIY